MVAVCGLRIVDWDIIDVYLDVLSVVSEGLTENGETTNIGSTFIYAETETDIASGVQMEAVDGNVGNLKTVDEGPFAVNY